MSATVFSPASAPLVPIVGRAEQFPIGRIFCVGRNYAAHAAEMGNAVDRSAPFYFTKSPAAVVLSGSEIPFPTMTSNLHHEMELAGYYGEDGIFGYGCSLDLTRRDLQAKAKEKARPWSVAKDFENSAVLGPITAARDVGSIKAQPIQLRVNGETRQGASLAEMIHDVPAILSDLALYYQLRAGDVILTGTPAGVGPLVRGDHAVGRIEGLEPGEIRIQS